MANDLDYDHHLNIWSREAHHDESTFLKDGIVNPAVWEQQSVKVLGLFKEAYTKGNPAFDMRHELRDSAPYMFWHNTARWTRAVISTVESGKALGYNELSWKEGNDWLAKIAVVNVKKSGGKTRSSNADLKKYVNLDKERLRQQIDWINPTIILCGGIFHFYKQIYGNDNVIGIPGAERCYLHKNRLVIDFWHFSCRINKEDTYKKLGELVQKVNDYLLATSS